MGQARTDQPDVRPGVAGNMLDEADQVLERLARCRTPRLIGVRHHSAAMARVMPRLLDHFRPKAILVEMPPDFASWLEHLGRPELEAPVALAACDQSRLLCFYPLADFSPELAAIRWAAAHQVPVVPCDLDLTTAETIESRAGASSADTADDPLVRRLLDRLGARDTGDLWEKLVETPSLDASPEAIRRAALLFGWLIRMASGGPTELDAHREAAMRAAVAAAPKDSVAVVGSFHAAALLPQPILWRPPEPLQKSSDDREKRSPPTTSLVPYSFAQLDWRSGYPAGILDPVWHQTMLEADGREQANRRVADLVVALCRRLRHDGHVAGTPDGAEIVRFARDLSRLRRQPAPGRAELLEAIQTVLVQGDLWGRGRAVAAACQAVLVGDRRGRLPPNVPRSGLAVDVEAAIARLKLPGPESIDAEPRQLRLDPLRSRLDRARAVLLRRLNLLGIPYAQRLDTEAIGNRENLTELWQVQWTHATAATLDAAGTYGVNITQACQAAVRRLLGADAADVTGPEPHALHPATVLVRLSAATECGLGDVVRDMLAELEGAFLQTASTANLIEAAGILERIAAGHVPGLPLRQEDAAPPDVEVFDVPPQLLNARPLVEAALRGLEGLRGSDDPRDVVALVELAAMIGGEAVASDEPARQADDGRAADVAPDLRHHAGRLQPLLPALRSRLWHLQRTGSPRMQGAAWGTLAMIGAADGQQLAAALSSWYDSASTSDGRKKLRLRLCGLMVPLLPLALCESDWLLGIEQRMAASPDEEFLARLPALRGGFAELSAADRAWLLADRLARLGASSGTATPARPVDDPLMQASAAAADRAGREAIARLLPDYTLFDVASSDAEAAPRPITQPFGQIPLADRWRLVLGVKGCGSPKARRAASTLDQLYGASAQPGRGYQEDLAGAGGGTEAPQPSARQWAKDVDRLFGKDVCQEVLAEAAANGRAAVLEHLNPESVRPSVDLLEQVLSLRGALPERELAMLRKLARHITHQLAQRLANRLRPALMGLSIARPTRRRSQRLDFGRTLDRNLDTAHRRADGRLSIAPRRLIYRTPARRHMDWHLIFVVDVSGSMDASVIYSALMAAIFSALPAIDVRFFAFSTEVIDFSERVDDPLSLLMEVEVGGGTHIGLGLRAARQAIKNPSRTLLVLVTDFEEGVSLPEMLSEVRALAESGVKLIGLAALDDEAKPRYHSGNAAAVAAAGMAVAAVSPERLADWIGDQIRGGQR